MAFIPAPNAIRICLQAVWEGQTVEICVGILKNTAVTLPDLATVTTDMEAWRVAEMVPLTSVSVTFTQWYALSLTSATSPSLITPIVLDTAGTDFAVTVPNNSTLVTTFQTDLRGRSYRGRAYWYGIAAANLFNSTEADPSYAAALTAAFAAINSYLTSGFAHVVISYQNNNVVRTTAARTPVTGYRTEVRMDSQRRRLEGRGS